MPTPTKEHYLPVNGFKVPIANLDKIFWPGEGITKGDIIEYYIHVWPWLQPHLTDRPLSLVRYPEGIAGDFFYQKTFPLHRRGLQLYPLVTAKIKFTMCWAIIWLL